MYTYILYPLCRRYIYEINNNIIYKCECICNVFFSFFVSLFLSRKTVALTIEVWRCYLWVNVFTYTYNIA